MKIKKNKCSVFARLELTHLDSKTFGELDILTRNDINCLKKRMIT